MESSRVARSNWKVAAMPVATIVAVDVPLNVTLASTEACGPVTVTSIVPLG